MSKKTDIETYHANHGVERNKRPLKNKEYRLEEYQRDDLECKSWCIQFRYGGGDVQHGSKNTNKRHMMDWAILKYVHGIDELKAFILPRIGQKQWAKFRGEGKTHFIVQRRVDGKNTKKSG